MKKLSDDSRKLETRSALRSRSCNIGRAAEEATQETLLQAYRSIHSFYGGDFAGWLMRVARNVCIDEWRRSRPEQEIGHSEFAEALATVARFAGVSQFDYLTLASIQTL
jgi:DNA-directed RNA polymerase specialized sigma24 family protein